MAGFFRALSTTLKFNKSLAELGIGSAGLQANVPAMVRQEAIKICLTQDISPHTAAARLYFTFLELDLISPTHRELSSKKLAKWGKKKLIGEPEALNEETVAVLRGASYRDAPEADLLDLCNCFYRWPENFT
jgi:hypothetical protein